MHNHIMSRLMEKRWEIYSINVARQREAADFFFPEKGTKEEEFLTKQKHCSRFSGNLLFYFLIE